MSQFFFMSSTAQSYRSSESPLLNNPLAELVLHGAPAIGVATPGTTTRVSPRPGSAERPGPPVTFRAGCSVAPAGSTEFGAAR